MAAFPEEPFYRTTIVKYTTLRFGLKPLDLGKTAVDKQFRSRHVATVIRCEKHHCPSNFVRLAKPADGIALATILRRCSPASPEASKSVKPGVSMVPGLIALTGIRRCLRSVVQVRAKERMEAFVAL
jgi:hypothetical protein